MVHCHPPLLLSAAWAASAKHPPQAVFNGNVLFDFREGFDTGPWVPNGDWYQNPQWIPLSKDAKVPYIQWQSICI